MRDIEPLSTKDGYGVVVPEDVDRALSGLWKGVPYAAADLYDRYSDAAREVGRAPGHPVAFGQELARRGHHRTKRVVAKGGRQVVAWVLTRP
jgi:hypothetical protein